MAKIEPNIILPWSLLIGSLITVLIIAHAVGYKAQGNCSRNVAGGAPGQYECSSLIYGFPFRFLEPRAEVNFWEFEGEREDISGVNSTLEIKATPLLADIAIWSLAGAAFLWCLASIDTTKKTKK